MSLNGQLNNLALGEIFEILNLSKRSGVLHISGKGEGRLVFHKGHVISASIYNRDKLAARLIQKGPIQDSDLEDALKPQKPLRTHTPLSTVLDDTRPPDSQDVMENIIRERMKEAIYELLSWKEGTFRFESQEPIEDRRIGDRDIESLLGRGLSPEYLILEGARLQDEDEMKADPGPSLSDPHS